MKSWFARSRETRPNIYGLMYYAAEVFKNDGVRYSPLKCSRNIKAGVGGKLNGTEINNGRCDAFANWNRWHSGSEGLAEMRLPLCSSAEGSLPPANAFLFLFFLRTRTKHWRWGAGLMLRLSLDEKKRRERDRKKGRAFNTQRAEMCFIKRFSELRGEKKASVSDSPLITDPLWLR